MRVPVNSLMRKARWAHCSGLACRQAGAQGCTVARLCDLLDSRAMVEQCLQHASMQAMHGKTHACMLSAVAEAWASSSWTHTADRARTQNSQMTQGWMFSLGILQAA